MQPQLLPWLLCIAWLLPLVSFGIIVLIGPRMGKHGILSSYVATGAILGSFALSLLALVIWVASFGIWGSESHEPAHGGESTAVAATEHAPGEATAQASSHEGHAPPRHFNG